MRATRLLTLLSILRQRGHVTADALATELDVSVRTIYRDIDELSTTGHPILGEGGPGGGFRLLAGPHDPLAGLSDRARLELLAALPTGTAPPVLGDRFHLDPVDWYRATVPVDHLATLVRAVAERRAIMMTYESWTTTREWTVEPLGIVLKAGVWYVVARPLRGGEPRIFRVSSVHAAALGARRPRSRASFDLAAFWADACARFERELHSGIATVRASPTGARRLAELSSHAARAVAAGVPERDGWLRVQLPIESEAKAALALLGIGPEVRIVEPASLRAQVRSLATKIVAQCRR